MGQGSGVAVSCGIGHRCGSDPELQWLWCRPVATALIGPLTWELPYAVGVALEKTKITNKKQKRQAEDLEGKDHRSCGPAPFPCVPPAVDGELTEAM